MRRLFPATSRNDGFDNVQCSHARGGALSYDCGMTQAPVPATQRYAWFWENRPLPIGSGSTMQRADAGHDGERTKR